MDMHPVISALLDDEPFDPAELTAALSEPEGANRKGAPSLLILSRCFIWCAGRRSLRRRRPRHGLRRLGVSGV
jgi:hypothetical protein